MLEACRTGPTCDVNLSMISSLLHMSLVWLLHKSLRDDLCV